MVTVLNLRKNYHCIVLIFISFWSPPVLVMDHFPLAKHWKKKASCQTFSFLSLWQYNIDSSSCIFLSSVLLLLLTLFFPLLISWQQDFKISSRKFTFYFSVTFLGMKQFEGVKDNDHWHTSLKWKCVETSCDMFVLLRAWWIWHGVWSNSFRIKI